MKNIIFKTYRNLIPALAVTCLLGAGNYAFAQAESPKEDDYFKIKNITAPAGSILEIGGLCTLPDGTLAATTRRGDIFMIKNPHTLNPVFTKFASGLHEVLGAEWVGGSLYVAQRGELTKITDTNNDGKGDLFETVYAWPITGNYHEYSFGPKLAPDGSFFVTLNLGFPDEWWHPKSMAPWRGWTLNITKDGKVTPWAAGMRSPCGISMIDGELWYTDNQGDWVGSGSLMKVPKGGFMGHPASLVWTNQPNSPLKLTQEQFFAHNKTRVERDERGRPVKPENIVNEVYQTKFDEKKLFPELVMPAVWLPHAILGISNTEIVKIPKGSFGPFEGQLLVGDQGQSMVSRVFLEKVNGEYQGAAIAFRSGFSSGVIRLAWLKDGSLAVGESNRGWGSAGEATMGLQRLEWNNDMPFEMKAIRAKTDGFEIEFTKPVDRKSAEDLASYKIEGFTYKYHGVYGSPPVATEPCPVVGVRVSEDGLKARLIVNNMRKSYIHTITIDGVREKEHFYSLVHPTAYYTLNNIPSGTRLTGSGISRRNSALAAANRSVSAAISREIAEAKTMAAKATTATKTTGVAKSTTAKKAVAVSVSKAPTYEEVKPLLQKNTCLACHAPTTRVVGPAYSEIAKRNYSVAQILALIKNPKPEHWPDYSTPMPPMPQVPATEATKIAQWIRSLK